MSTLNRIPATVAARHGVSAATDITGFGLAGHASNVARESGLTLEIRLSELPVLPQARELAPRNQPGGLKANRRQFEPLVEDRAPADEAARALVYDPQTSGGLLLLVPAARAAALLQELPNAREIGVARERGERPLRLV
jgi:selenide,water dikinase